MKKLLSLLLVLSIALCGCANSPGDETTAAPTETTAAPTDPGLYAPQSQVEIDSAGAVRQFDLPATGYFAAYAVDQGVLLLSGAENTRLELLTGEKGTIANSLALPVSLRGYGWQLTRDGLAYYDPAQNQGVYLDGSLQELRRIDLPADIIGMPAFAPDGGEIFYCAGTEIRALDTDRGITRMIKSHGYENQTLLGSYFGGQLVLCEILLESGEQKFLHVSTVDGATCSEDAQIEQLDTTVDSYIAVRRDGVVRQYIFGSLEGEPKQFTAEATYITPMADQNRIVTQLDTQEGCIVSAFSLTTGKKQAQVTLPSELTPCFVSGDRAGVLWLLTESEEPKLLRWDPAASAVEEEATYTGPVYTVQAPDEEGLKQLQKRVDDLNSTHGVMLRIWQNAIKTPGAHTLSPEYQTQAIAQTLDRVESILNQFPENFLYRSVNTKLRICIVRSVDGQRMSTRYWDDGDAFIILSTGADIETDLLQAISYVVDCHTLGNSPMLDSWEELNPTGFAYSDEAPNSVDYLVYLEGESRAFVNGASMASMSDDRANLFWQAMLPGNEELFASETMQQKLLLLCRAIRDAWRLENKTETFLWEQYLNEPIAYVKE